MKKLSTILAAGKLALTLSAPALAIVSTNHAITQPDAETITELQHASETAKRQARNGNKNNFAFGRKRREIDHLTQRMENGQQVTQKPDSPRAAAGTGVVKSAARKGGGDCS